MAMGLGQCAGSVQPLGQISVQQAGPAPRQRQIIGAACWRTAAGCFGPVSIPDCAPWVRTPNSRSTLGQKARQRATIGQYTNENFGLGSIKGRG